MCGGGGGPAPHVPRNYGASLSRQAILLLGAFLAMHPLTPVPSAVSAQPTVLLSPYQFYQPLTLALNPCQHRQTVVPGRGAQG